MGNDMNYYKFIFIFWTIASILACKKYLDKVPNKSLSVLTTIAEYQQLLDNEIIYQLSPSLGDLSCDDYYLKYSDWQSRFILVKNCYIWARDIYEGNNTINNDWNYSYQNIYYANVVLDGLKTLKGDGQNDVDYRRVKAHALFVRAYHHYLLEELFGNIYKPSTADVDLGIPLRLTSKLDVKTTRATVSGVYQRIIEDLEEANSYLADPTVPVAKNRPSKPAIYAMLARVYLTMQDYAKARLYADSSIESYGKLINYNSLSLTSNYPFSAPDNEEVLFITYQIPYGGYIASPTNIIDSILYDSYDSNDLRKQIFFTISPSSGTPYVKGQYSGTSTPFNGIANDEVYLIRAECAARAGDKDAALEDLNELLINRWVTSEFTPLWANSADEALELILNERRKELPFRGVRWADLRRLNQDERFAKTLTRILDGNTYTLAPNDPRYVFPIPDDEINLSGIQQNPR